MDEQLRDYLDSELRVAAQHGKQSLARWAHQRHLYLGHPEPFVWGECKLCFPPMTWQSRLHEWWHAHRPRFHFGPC